MLRLEQVKADLAEFESENRKRTKIYTKTFKALFVRRSHNHGYDGAQEYSQLTTHGQFDQVLR